MSSLVAFPNLYVETLEPTILSILVFAMADLREIVRQKPRPRVSTSISDQILQLPLPARDVGPIIKRNKELLKHKLRPNQLVTLKFILQLQQQQRQQQDEHNNVTIHHFGDDNPTNECVYGILTNSETRQIQLAFRGSVTMQDWKMDARVVSGDLPNPLYTSAEQTNEQPHCLGVHVGFRDYLYDASTTGQKNKIDKILDQVGELMDTNPGFRLVITGSLRTTAGRPRLGTLAFVSYFIRCFSFNISLAQQAIHWEVRLLN
jgi:hypothetical protein